MCEIYTVSFGEFKGASDYNFDAANSNIELFTNGNNQRD